MGAAADEAINKTAPIVHMRRDLQTAQAEQDDSMHRRQAAAAQRRDGRHLDPHSSAYQISVLLSHSSFFEHKLQSDARRALAAARCAAFARSETPAPSADVKSSLNPACSGELDGDSAACANDLYAPQGANSSSGGASACGAPSASARGVDVARVALALSKWGYTVIVRRVLHSKTYWTKSFDNTFIVALDTSSSMGVEYIVVSGARLLY